MIATKAARVVKAATGRKRGRVRHAPRAHSGGGNSSGPRRRTSAVRGTSNTEAGLRFGVPVFGTAAPFLGDVVLE